MKENFDNDKENKKGSSGFSSGSEFGKLGFGQEKETFGGESDRFGEGFGREKKDGEKDFGKNFAEDSFGRSLQEEKKNVDSFREKRRTRTEKPGTRIREIRGTGREQEKKTP